jgi:hypothetical protein
MPYGDNTDIASYFDYISRLTQPGGAMQYANQPPLSATSSQPISYEPSKTVKTERMLPSLREQTPQDQEQDDIRSRVLSGSGQKPYYSEDIPQLNLQNVPQAPQDNYKSSFEAFKNPLIALAMLGTAFTKNGAVNAMTFATGAMNGYREGQTEQFEQNRQNFNERMKQIMDQNQIELNRYRAAWDYKTELDNKKFAETFTASVQNDDPLGQALLKSGKFKEFIDLQMAREKAQESAQKAFDVQEAREAAKQAEVDRLKKDPGVIAQAKAIESYDQPMPPLSRANPRNQAINELVTEHSEAAGTPYETPNYAAKNKFITGLGSLTPQSPGGQVTSMNTIVGHLNTLDRLIDDLKSPSNSVTFRRAAQAIQIQFGLSSAPTNFDVAREMIGGEIVKLVVGAGGTGEDREKTRNAFDRANSTKLLHDAVAITREIIGSRVGSLVNTAKGLHAEGQLMRILKPETIEALEGEKGPGEPPEPGAKFHNGHWYREGPNDTAVLIK